MFGLGKLVDGDALLQHVAEIAYSRYIVPLLADVRSGLLAAIAGEPPTSWAGALERNGLQNLPTEAQRRLWRAAVDAAAVVRTASGVPQLVPEAPDAA